jgi:hypothetical protein
MIPIVFGLGGLIARVAVAAVIPRIVKALSAGVSRPSGPKDLVQLELGRTEGCPIRSGPGTAPGLPVPAPALEREKPSFSACRLTRSNPISSVDPSGLFRLKLKRITLEVRNKQFCSKDHGTIFAIIEFTPFYETLSGEITLEDFKVTQYAKGILSGVGEIHVNTIRLISPPENPKGMGIPTEVSQNPTGFMFGSGGGFDIPTGLTIPIINSDMRLNFGVEANLSTGRSTYSGVRRASTGWFHIGPEGITAPIWGTD